MATANPNSQIKVDSTYLRRTGVAFLSLVCIFVIYSLSLGPALKLSGVTASTSKTALPQWIKIFYYPLLNSEIAPLNAALDRYVKLWIGIY